MEQVQPYAAIVDTRLSTDGMSLAISDLTRLECRIKPIRDGDVKLLQDFDDFFGNAIAQVVPLSCEVVDRATEIRSQYGFKTPDAIRSAAAVVSGRDAFYTNDRRLDRLPI